MLSELFELSELPKLTAVCAIWWHPDHGTSKGEWVGKRCNHNSLVGLNITLDGMTLAQWQALDPAVNDVGSTYKDVSISTQADEIIIAARKLLGL
eukprot:COSAG02_NODE_474_length_21578_cov_225.787746_19_plen_95_part_00